MAERALKTDVRAGCVLVIGAEDRAALRDPSLQLAVQPDQVIAQRPRPLEREFEQRSLRGLDDRGRVGLLRFLFRVLVGRRVDHATDVFAWIWISGPRSVPPNSRTVTSTPDSSLRRAAMAEPAEPEPMMT